MNSSHRDVRYNTMLYLLSCAVSNLTYIFGDASYLVPSLAIRLQAPSWLVALPNVTNVSLAYLPIIYMGWALGGGASRKKICAVWIALSTLPLLCLAALLYHGGTSKQLLFAIGISYLCYSLMRGFDILPNWDLFAHIFPADHRGGLIGKSSVVGNIAALLAAGAAAWLIGAHNPLGYPRNYALSIFIFCFGTGLTAWISWMVREPHLEPVPGHGSFVDYLADLRTILRTDKAFVLTLCAAAMGAAINASSPLFLVYAHKYAGFQTESISRLIAIRPYCLMACALGCGYLTKSAGPHRVASLTSFLIVPAVVLSKLLHGSWQLLPMLLGEAAASVYSYALLCAMHHAPRERNHQYITLFYCALIVPATSPLWLGYVMDSHPQITLATLALLGVAGATTFLLADPRRYAAKQSTTILNPLDASL